LTECVRLSLLIILTLATNNFAARVIPILGSRLYTACQDICLLSGSTVAERRLYLWTLITAMMGFAKGIRERQWLVAQAAIFAIELDCKTYEDLHDVCNGYLYTWTIQMEDLMDVVRAVEKGERAVRDL
jgi:hypothetical protein